MIADRAGHAESLLFSTLFPVIEFAVAAASEIRTMAIDTKLPFGTFEFGFSASFAGFGAAVSADRNHNAFASNALLPFLASRVSSPITIFAGLHNVVAAGSAGHTDAIFTDAARAVDESRLAALFAGVILKISAERRIPAQALVAFLSCGAGAFIFFTLFTRIQVSIAA